jgi:hypothetical protein
MALVIKKKCHMNLSGEGRLQLNITYQNFSFQEKVLEGKNLVKKEPTNNKMTFSLFIKVFWQYTAIG